MVKGVEKFRARMRDMPENVREELVVSMQRAADRLVDEIRVVMYTRTPLTDAEVEVNWTWGEAPVGAITIGTVHGGRNKGLQYEKMKVTVYAVGRGIRARWFERGTPERRHKSGKPVGKIKATPFFYPTYRANRDGIKRAMTSAVRRAVRKS